MTELYTLSLFFRSGQKVDLFFQSKGRATEIFDIFRLVEPPSGTSIPSIDDGYGSRLVLMHDHPAIYSVLLQDCGRASEAAVEVSLMQARNQVRAQERARHDPMINKAQVKAPIVMPPGFNGCG